MPWTERQKNYQKLYRKENKDHILEVQREYRKQKEAIWKEPVKCCCGKTVQRMSMYAHIKSQKHQIFTGQKKKKTKLSPTRVDNIEFTIYFD